MAAPARRSHVPKFGNWDANDHMPYTVVFDHARQGRGKPINPNDPTENPNVAPAGRGGGAPRRNFNPNDPEDSSEGISHQPRQERPQERQPERPVVQQATGIARDGNGSGTGGGRAGGQQQPHQVAAGAERRRGSSGQGNPPSRGPSADLTKRTSRDNGLDRNVESPSTSFSADQSPAHPAGNQAPRAATRLGGNSPAWDPTRRRSTGEEGPMFAPATPNRSRLGNGKTTREDSYGKGPSAALPKFGAWDAQDPGSGDGFTVIFNNARNEKKTGGPVNLARTPDKDNSDLYGTPDHNSSYHKGHSGRSSWWCCFAPDTKA